MGHFVLMEIEAPNSPPMRVVIFPTFTGNRIGMTISFSFIFISCYNSKKKRQGPFTPASAPILRCLRITPPLAYDHAIPSRTT